MEWQAEIAHQILEGLEGVPNLNAPILAINRRHDQGLLITDAESWAGAIDYDVFVAHCTWLSEEGLVEPYIVGSSTLIRTAPRGQCRHMGTNMAIHSRNG